MLDHSFKMDHLMVKRYYSYVAKGLNSKNIVGGPVSDDNNTIGRVLAYNKKTGMILIDLDVPIHYKILLNSKVPFDHIIFSLNA